MTTKKERAEALARMTKAELVKTIKALDARVTKLLNALNTSGRELEESRKLYADRNGAAAVLTESPLCEPRDVVKAALDGYETQQADLQRDTAKAYNAERGHRMAFPWEQSLPNGFINPDDVAEE